MERGPQRFALLLNAIRLTGFDYEVELLPNGLFSFIFKGGKDIIASTDGLFCAVCGDSDDEINGNYLNFESLWRLRNSIRTFVLDENFFNLE